MVTCQGHWDHSHDVSSYIVCTKYSDTHVELELGVEILVRHHVHHRHQRVHVPLVGHQPDDGRLPGRFVLGLGVVLKPLANILNDFQQVLLGPRVGNLIIN